MILEIPDHLLAPDRETDPLRRALDAVVTARAEVGRLHDAGIHAADMTVIALDIAVADLESKWQSRRRQ